HRPVFPSSHSITYARSNVPAGKCLQRPRIRADGVLIGMSSQTASLVASPPAARPWALRWLKPSPAELLFLAVVLWLIAFTVAGVDGTGLLRDSQTGYHVRIGEY